MRCSKCGNETAQGASFCPVCGSPVDPNAAPAQFQPQPPPPQLNTWLVPAILATIFCCLPFGIVSIVFASKANSALGAGNYPLAQENAAKAKTWFWVAFGIGIVTTVISLIIQVILFAAQVSAAAD
ncbi:MAG: CD225/dispanin family protein [Lentisphaeria bacterium]|nr:CD225/dispanin family protein [Lentisphaeria bacterium]